MPSASDSLRASVTAAELEVEGGEDSGAGAHVATEAESLDGGVVNAETTDRQSGGEQDSDTARHSADIGAAAEAD